MQGIQISDAKAPWVMFDRRAVEDRDASIKEGRYVAKDVDFVLITPHGSKDQIERVVSEWFEHLEQQVREGRFERHWLIEFKRSYADWVDGKGIPLQGTPIVNWPVVSPAQVQMLQHLKILTVEVLAQANEETIARLGMGGRNLVDKAREFLKQIEGGKSTEEVVALREQVAGLKAVAEKQQEQIQALLASQNGAKDAFMQQQAQGRGEPDDIGDILDGNKPALKKL